MQSQPPLLQLALEKVLNPAVEDSRQPTNTNKGLPDIENFKTRIAEIFELNAIITKSSFMPHNWVLTEKDMLTIAARIINKYKDDAIPYLECLITNKILPITMDSIVKTFVELPKDMHISFSTSSHETAGQATLLAIAAFTPAAKIVQYLLCVACDDVSAPMVQVGPNEKDRKKIYYNCETQTDTKIKNAEIYQLFKIKETFTKIANCNSIEVLATTSPSIGLCYKQNPEFTKRLMLSYIDQFANKSPNIQEAFIVASILNVRKCIKSSSEGKDETQAVESIIRFDTELMQKLTPLKAENILISWLLTEHIEPKIKMTLAARQYRMFLPHSTASQEPGSATAPIQKTEDVTLTDQQPAPATPAQ